MRDWLFTPVPRSYINKMIYVITTVFMRHDSLSQRHEFLLSYKGRRPSPRRVSACSYNVVPLAVYSRGYDMVFKHFLHPQHVQCMLSSTVVAHLVGGSVRYPLLTYPFPLMDISMETPRWRHRISREWQSWLCLGFELGTIVTIVRLVYHSNDLGCQKFQAKLEILDWVAFKSM